ncbi:MAG: tail fiber protein [Rhodocyclaceae bacterium]|nr:tail fiber protein [Rhodocyclaceae bacterium]
MGTAAPANYLVCDGSIHNIADYPDLAAHFAATFGAANRFGGDGATTFAVPNLQGEFLRGAGTNGHPNQGNGAAVGEHQDATFISDGFCNNNIAGFSYPAEGYPMDASYKPGIPRINDDSHLQTAPRAGYIGSYGKQVSSSGYTVEWHSTRPTNTSVLWCICARNTYRAGCAYSTDEQPVGTWIDGKTIYQKVVMTQMQATMQTFAQRAWTQLNIAGMPAIETLVDGRIHVDATGAGKPTAYISASFYVNANGIYYYADTAYGWRQVFVVLRYTKP